MSTNTLNLMMARAFFYHSLGENSKKVKKTREERGGNMVWRVSKSCELHPTESEAVHQVLCNGKDVGTVRRSETGKTGYGKITVQFNADTMWHERKPLLNWLFREDAYRQCNIVIKSV